MKFLRIGKNIDYINTVYYCFLITSAYSVMTSVNVFSNVIDQHSSQA